MKILSRIFYKLGKMEMKMQVSHVLLKSSRYIQPTKKMNLHIANLNSLFKYQTKRTTSCT